MAKVITGIQWGESCVERDIKDSRIRTKVTAFGDEERIGMIKAFTTHSGKGGFPTEQFGKVATRMGELDKEHDLEAEGQKRYGWLDLVMVKKVISEQRLTSLVIEQIDTIGEIGYITPILLCKMYERNHTFCKEVPDDIENCKPSYETFIGGWDTEKCRTWKDVHSRAKRYIEHIEKYVGIPVRYIGIGSKLIPKPQN